MAWSSSLLAAKSRRANCKAYKERGVHLFGKWTDWKVRSSMGWGTYLWRRQNCACGEINTERFVPDSGEIVNLIDHGWKTEDALWAIFKGTAPKFKPLAKCPACSFVSTEKTNCGWACKRENCRVVCFEDSCV